MPTFYPMTKCAITFERLLNTDGRDQPDQTSDHPVPLKDGGPAKAPPAFGSTPAAAVSLSDKGQAALFSLAPKLVQHYPDLHLVFIGPDGQQGERQGLEAATESFGLGKHILFTGVMEDIPTAMAAMDVLAHFPLSEAFGLVLLEAMASGLPVVASRVGGCAEVVADGVTGLLVPPSDAEGRFSVLSYMLDDEKGAGRRASMGAAARERATSFFSMGQETAAVQRLYQEVMQNMKLL